MGESSETNNLDGAKAPLRVLFCIGVSQSFFDARSSAVAEILGAITEAFANLSERFGVEIIGTMDDDQLMVGPSTDYPWTAYILADAPHMDAIAGICNIVRDTAVGEHKLWRYLRIEAKVGRPLFFGGN